MILLEISKPNYDAAIFEVLPTLFLESFKIELPEPYSEQKIKDKKILKLFTEETDISIIVIIDAMGTNQISGFLYNRWITLGKPTLSSVVPTATGNAIPSIYIGLPPELHGLVGQKFYLPEIGNYINTLNGTVIAEGVKASLHEAGVNIRSFLWHQPIIFLPELDNFVFGDVLSTSLYGGLRDFYGERLQFLGYKTGYDAINILVEATKQLAMKNKKGILFAYFHQLDSIGHLYGYNSTLFEQEAKLLNDYFRLLVERIEKLTTDIKKKINIIALSDHGQVILNDVIELSQDKIELLSSLGLKNVLSSGRFKYVYAEKDAAIEALIDLLEDYAIVMPINDAIKSGFWPLLDEYEEQFLNRAGSYVILPRKDIDLKAERTKKDDFFEDIGWEKRKLRGSHGGLTRDELEVPFIIFRFPND